MDPSAPTRHRDHGRSPGVISIDPPHHVRRPIMLQGWHNLAALHWSFRPEDIQPHLPTGFTVDTHDGLAWVGLLPFHMRGIRIPGLPAFGPLSTFPETNIRTYIVDGTGRRAVWFFSLDVTRLIPALVARVSYQLPYCWATMEISTTSIDGADYWEYRSRRRWPRGIGDSGDSYVQVRVGEQIPSNELTALDHFLTARWALGTTFAGKLLWAKVDHPRWPLHHAEAIAWNESLFRAAGLPEPTGAPYVRWSPGVEVRIGLPRSVPTSQSNH